MRFREYQSKASKNAVFKEKLERLRFIEDRNRYEGSLFEFVKAAWSSIDSSPFKSCWAIEAFCDHLECTTMGLLPRLLANYPPRASKTTVASICWPAWVWARSEISMLSGPQVNFLCASYNSALALTNSNAMRRLLTSPWYQKYWGERFGLREDQNSKSNFANTKGGSRISTSVGGSLLGLGGQVIVVDDPQNTETEKVIETDADRRKVASWFKEVRSTRLNDPKESAIVVVMQRLHECLLPGTLVRTPSGDRPIESLVVGDTVFGSDGWQQITHTGSRPYSGRAFGVRLYGHPDICWTTDNHLYLTQDGWKRADQLSKKDWVRFPICGQKKQRILWEQPGWARVGGPTGNFTGGRPHRHQVNVEEIRRLASEGKGDTEISKILGVHRNTVMSHRSMNGISRLAETNAISGRKHLRDPEFWRLVGYWLAEGSVIRDIRLGKRKPIVVRITFGQHEMHYVEECISTLAKYGVKSNYIHKPSVLEVVACSSQIAAWLEKHFGSGAHHKRIPEFVFGLPDICRQEVLEGWLRGDGCVRTATGQRSGTSVSRLLLYGMQRIALSLGNRAMIMGGNGKPRQSEINGKKVMSSGNGAELRLDGHEQVYSRVKSGVAGPYAWYRIRNVETKKYTGKVYDITTPSHDFVVGNATVHNSDLSGVILDSDEEEWVHLCIPMEFDEARRAPTIILPQYEYDGEPQPWTDPRTKDGELMWPERFGRREVERMKGIMGPYMAAGRLQQAPVPKGGGIIMREWWQLWDQQEAQRYGLEWKGALKEFPPFELVVGSLDTAYGEKQENDFNAMTVWGIWIDRNRNRRVMLAYAWAKRLKLNGKVIAQEPNEANVNYMARQRSEWGLVEWVADTCKRYKVQRMLIEDKTRGRDVANEIHRLYARANWGVELVNPVKDKISRAHSVVPLFTDNVVWAPSTPWSDGPNGVIIECAKFPKGAHDDQVDAVTMFLIWARENGILERANEMSAALEDEMRPKRNDRGVAEMYGV